ncbi:MAG: hypothetical protein H7Z13_04305 [Ferruginibacter sp.]|nr:hypothetical protein [Ferruginibacter sp.]
MQPVDNIAADNNPFGVEQMKTDGEIKFNPEGVAIWLLYSSAGETGGYSN